MNPTFPESVDLSSLETTHRLVRVVPSGNEALGYSIVLGNDWVSESDLGTQHVGAGTPMRIGLFADHVGPDATVVQITCTRVPFEVDVRDWVEYDCARNGTRLLQVRKRAFTTGSGIDAGGLRGPEAARQVVRLVARPDGGRIFMVVVTTPEARYTAAQDDVAIATHSFKLLRPVGSAQLEQQLVVEAGEPAWRVSYPASWRARPVTAAPAGKSAVDLLLARENQLAAYVRVKAIDPGVADAAQTLETTDAELSDAGVQRSDPWSNDEDPDVGQVEGITNAFRARGRLGDAAVEIRTGTVARDALVFVATMLSVERTADPILWMRSKRAYQIALATARRG